MIPEILLFIICFIMLVFIFILFSKCFQKAPITLGVSNKNSINILEEGAIGDGIFDNSPIFTNIYNNYYKDKNQSISIYIPSGRFRIKTMTTFSMVSPFNITIYGVSTFESILLCDTDGFTITQTGLQRFAMNGNNFTIKDLTFESLNKLKVPNYTALRLESINVYAEAMIQGVFQNLSFHPSNPVKDDKNPDGFTGWQYGIRIINSQLVRISEVGFSNGGTAICFGRDAGETESDFDHTFISVNYWINNCYFTSAVFGIKIGTGQYQGFEIWGSYFVGVSYGIVWLPRSLNNNESPPDMLIISGCHIDSTVAGIDTDGLSTLIAANNYFLSGSKSNFISSITVSNGDRISITGNIFKAAKDLNILPLGNAIQLNTTKGAIISGNSFNDWHDYAIILKNDQSNLDKNNRLELLNTFNNIDNPVGIV